MKKIYNKLVRDHIINIINQQNKIVKYEYLNQQQYQYYLKKKLIEESNEVDSSLNKEELIYELADVFEVIESLIKSYDININDILKIKQEKAIKNGSFHNKILLKYVEDKEE